MLESIVKFFLEAVDGMGYTGIVILMALESSIIPFPSEIIVPPAGYLAAQGKMNIYLVILSGTIGTLIGALVNYYIAAYMGRGLLKKYSKFFFLDDEKLDKVDVFFAKHGEITTFTGRLIPIIRQYIPFPAGLARMNLPKFCFFTSLGAGIWIMVLALVGYFVGNNPELIQSKLIFYAIIILAVMSLVVACYVYYHRKQKSN
jgi:membrane protein DedA with SNARE-associated domain